MNCIFLLSLMVSMPMIFTFKENNITKHDTNLSIWNMNEFLSNNVHCKWYFTKTIAIHTISWIAINQNRNRRKKWRNIDYMYLHFVAQISYVFFICYCLCNYYKYKNMYKNKSNEEHALFTCSHARNIYKYTHSNQIQIKNTTNRMKQNKIDGFHMPERWALCLANFDMGTLSQPLHTQYACMLGLRTLYAAKK